MQGRPIIQTGKPKSDAERMKQAAAEAAFLDPIPLKQDKV